MDILRELRSESENMIRKFRQKKSDELKMETYLITEIIKTFVCEEKQSPIIEKKDASTYVFIDPELNHLEDIKKYTDFLCREV